MPCSLGCLRRSPIINFRSTQFGRRGDMEGDWCTYHNEPPPQTASIISVFHTLDNRAIVLPLPSTRILPPTSSEAPRVSTTVDWQGLTTRRNNTPCPQAQCIRDPDGITEGAMWDPGSRQTPPPLCLHTCPPTPATGQISRCELPDYPPYSPLFHTCQIRCRRFRCPCPAGQ